MARLQRSRGVQAGTGCHEGGIILSKKPPEWYLSPSLHHNSLVTDFPCRNDIWHPVPLFPAVPVEASHRAPTKKASPEQSNTADFISLSRNKNSMQAKNHDMVPNSQIDNDSRVWEEMISGREYDATHPYLLEKLNATKDRIWEYNKLRPSMLKERNELLRELLGQSDEDTFINQPFYCDYGCNICVGRRFFANFNFTVLDEAPVTVGDDCFIGPNVSIYTACHSTDPVERNSRREWAKPVTIGDNVWIGGSVTILPGVTIGSNVTIGAGSVVVKDIPDGCVAVGNPCRVVKFLEKE